MTQQMHVLAIKETGHILAAVAQSNAGGDPEVAALAGSDLPVIVPRNKGNANPAIAIPVPDALLELKALPYDAAVIAHPLAYVVDGGRIAKLPSLPPAAGSALSTSIVTVHGAASEISVAVAIIGKDDPAVRRAMTGKIPAGQTHVDLALTVLPGNPAASIPAGNYYLLVAEGGRRLRFEPEAA